METFRLMVRALSIGILICIDFFIWGWIINNWDQIKSYTWLHNEEFSGAFVLSMIWIFAHAVAAILLTIWAWLL